MKPALLTWIILILLCVSLSACHFPSQAPPADENSNEQAEMTISPEDAFAAEGAYPVEGSPIQQAEAAYPVNEENLVLLLRTWSLSRHAEDGIIKDPGRELLTFNPDGRYEIVTDAGSETGTWEAQLAGFDAVLILNKNTENLLVLEIITLNETWLQLHYWQGDAQIDEDYLPAE